MKAQQLLETLDHDFELTSEFSRNLAFVPRKVAASARAHSTGTRMGSNAVVDLASRISRPMELPRMDFCDGWYHAEAILDDGRNRKA